MRKGLAVAVAGVAIAAPNLAMRALTFGAVHPVASGARELAPLGAG